MVRQVVKLTLHIVPLKKITHSHIIHTYLWLDYKERDDLFVFSKYNLPIGNFCNDCKNHQRLLNVFDHIIFSLLVFSSKVTKETLQRNVGYDPDAILLILLSDAPHNLNFKSSQGVVLLVSSDGPLG